MLLTLFKKEWKSNWKLLFAIMAVITMYFAVIIGMYDPTDGDILKQLVALKLPEELLAAFGFIGQDNSLLGFLTGYLYGFLLLALPLIPIVVMANRLIAAKVDRGSMSSILSSAVKRRQVTFTQAIFLISVVLVLVLYMAVTGIVLSELNFPGLLDIGRFALLNVGLFIMLLAVSSLCFFFSCLFIESRFSLAFGAGLPILFLIIQMLVNYDSSLKVLRWFSLFSLYVPNDFLSGASVIVPLAVLGVISLVLYSTGVLVFDRKDLPL